MCMAFDRISRADMERRNASETAFRFASAGGNNEREILASGG